MSGRSVQAEARMADRAQDAMLPGSGRHERAAAPRIPPAETIPLDPTAHPHTTITDTTPVSRRGPRAGRKRSWKWVVPTLYILFLLVPIYWLLNMSLKTNQEIVS